MGIVRATDRVVPPDQGVGLGGTAHRDWQAPGVFDLDVAHVERAPKVASYSTMPNANTAGTVAAQGEKSLDLGCGRDKLPGAIGIDANPRSDADVIHDLDRFPWPFDDDTFGYVRALDVLEHVADFDGCMKELHRV